MDLLTGNVKKLYFRYLGAAFGSAIISSIYGLVDTAMVGQYHGPQGAAAMAVVAPVWNIIYSLGLAGWHRRLRAVQHSPRPGPEPAGAGIFSPAAGRSPGGYYKLLVIFLLDAPLLPCSVRTRRCSPGPGLSPSGQVGRAGLSV